MTLKDAIAADTLRALFNQDEFATRISYVSVDLVGGADITYADVPAIIDPHIDLENDGLVETAIDLVIVDGQVWTVSLAKVDPLAGHLELGETFLATPSGATGNVLALDRGRTALLFTNPGIITLLAADVITGDDSGATATVHPTTPELAAVGVPSPKAGDYFDRGGYRWTVERALPEADRFTHVLACRRGATP